MPLSLEEFNDLHVSDPLKRLVALYYSQGHRIDKLTKESGTLTIALSKHATGATTEYVRIHCPNPLGTAFSEVSCHERSLRTPPIASGTINQMLRLLEV
jgi:hypothetical protein